MLYWKPLIKRRSLDPRVIQVNATLTGCYEVVMVANMDGQMMADVRPLVSINVSVIVEDSHGRRESARSGGGGRVAYSYFTEKENALSYAREAVREALTNLKAEPAPAGTMPVVLVQDGQGYFFMKPLDMVWRVILIARDYLLFQADWVSRLLLQALQLWTMVL